MYNNECSIFTDCLYRYKLEIYQFPEIKKAPKIRGMAENPRIWGCFWVLVTGIRVNQGEIPLPKNSENIGCFGYLYNLFAQTTSDFCIYSSTIHQF